MKILKTSALLLSLSLPFAAVADDNLTRDAAISGAVGGALGGAIGAEVGGREGATVGAAVGAALGTQIGTKDSGDGGRARGEVIYRDDHHRDYHSGDGQGVPQSRGGFCPPGQAKKGRC